jgi:hypothetical protein
MGNARGQLGSLLCGHPEPRCCVARARGMLKPDAPAEDQIAMTSSSNATATRRVACSSTASS